MANKKNVKSSSKSNNKKTEKKVEQNTGKQVFAILVFFASVLFFVFAVADGPKVWGVIHRFILGFFGVCAFVWPIVIGYFAAIISFNKPMNRKKKLQALGFSVCVFLVGTIVEVIVRQNNGSYKDFLTEGYKSAIKGGGVVGGLLGYPFSSWFGTIGATVILVVIFLVVLFLVLGITLDKFLTTVSKPAVKISEEHQKRVEIKKKEKEGLDFNYSGFDENDDIDLPIDNKEAAERRKKRKKESEISLKEKRKKLVATYNGEEYFPNQDIDVEVEEDIPENSVVDSKEEKSLDDIISKFNDDDSARRPGKAKKEKVEKSVKDIEVVTEEKSKYKLPPIDLLVKGNGDSGVTENDELRSNAELLVNTLKSFGVETRIVDISRGPSVTRYELQPAAGVKISRITSLADDIALNLASSGVRIEAPIPNKAAVGIEVPNKKKASVNLREVIDSPQFSNATSKLNVAVGKDVAGNIITTDIAKMPHLLVAGTTGSGKSVCINSFILSVLYNATPDEVKLVLIDPKMVEFEVYNGLPHLYVPVVSDARKASGALSWAVNEMENRYKIFSECRVRDIYAYNEMARVSDEFEIMPQILIVVDEFADLMMVASSEVEDSVCRLAQKARAAGMHLIIATQRPSTDVITGVIKANIPSRIALTVSNQTDSRIIIDTGGAEKLIGKGDMLLYPVGLSKPMRVQGCWVSTEEIKNVVDYIIKQKDEMGGTVYDSEIEQEIERLAAETKGKKSKNDFDGELDEDEDPLLNDAIDIIVEIGSASTSLLQRRLKLGYARAARVIDQLEAKGIVGPSEGAKPRKVLITKQDWQEMKMSMDE